MNVGQTLTAAELKLEPHQVLVGSTGITAKGLVKVPLDAMAHGVYLLRMTDGARTESTRVAY